MENLTDSINNQCCVCFNIIDENEKCFLKCSHFLCQTCIDSWFDQYKTTCPMCRDVIKYYKKDLENFRIIHSRRNRQLQEQVMIDNDHHRQIVVFCRISFILNLISLYFIFDYMFENESLNRSLRSCITNNTLVQSMVDNCEGTNIMNINVYNPIDHTLRSCSFPVYFIDKCFNY